MQTAPAIWFPTIKTNTGTDVFTKRLVKGLNTRGIKAEITWLPLRAEYAPWTVPVPKAPVWATTVHVNTWLHPRFIPSHLPLVATLHHAIHHPDARSYKGRLRAAYHKYWIAPIERQAMQRADKVIAVSQFVADSARQTLLDAPIQVIHNGINTGVFKPRQRARNSEKPYQLLYVGSWMARKGVDLLAPIMRELGDGFELRYTGGPDSEKAKTNMPCNMIDIGRLQGDAAVLDAMQTADILLFPSRSEGHPLVAIEAMACGLPVVGSRIAPLIEVIDHGETGLLCQQDDIAGFVEAVQHLSRDRELYDAIQHKAPSCVRERFSEDATIEKYLDVYRTITSATLRRST